MLTLAVAVFSYKFTASTCTCRYRVRAENSVGKGPFGGYGTSSTLSPPPSPPLLTLASASHHSLRVSWGKKTNKALSYTLHLASKGKQLVDKLHRQSMGYSLSVNILDFVHNYLCAQSVYNVYSVTSLQVGSTPL